MTPGTSFAGTDPENELPAGDPDVAAPGELEPGIVSAGVCATKIGEYDSRSPASRNVQPRLKMIRKAVSYRQSLLLPDGGNILFPLAISNNGYLLRQPSRKETRSWRQIATEETIKIESGEPQPETQVEQ